MYTRIFSASAIGLMFTLFAACSSDTPSSSAQTVANQSSADTVTATPEPITLDGAINSNRRVVDKARDQFRNPKETLEFFEVQPDLHIAEIWPGWYTQILAPYVAGHGGTYTAILYPETERTAERIATFKDAVSDRSIYGVVEYGALGPDTTEMMPAESADILLTFRNVHNWMGRGYAEDVFAQAYAALKPGGIFGVVEHRLPETAVQDPRGASGYVQESYVKTLAQEAGFEFVAASEVNANPKDTADHPFGVWTLPPRSRVPDAGTPEADGFNAEYYANIGESDRMTLKFRKPL